MGDTPFQHAKLIASDFGGTRNPLVISWPKRVRPRETPHSQFHHVIDVVPTIYEILGIKPPEVVYEPNNMTQNRRSMHLTKINTREIADLA